MINPFEIVLIFLVTLWIGILGIGFYLVGRGHKELQKELREIRRKNE